MIFPIVALTALVLMGFGHLYLWRRLVRDVSAPGSAWRRAGTLLAVGLPVLVVANLVVGRSEAPFTLQRVLAWPGYLWLATALYLLMAVGLGEIVRPLLRRGLERRAAAAGAAGNVGAPAGGRRDGSEADGTEGSGPVGSGADTGGSAGPDGSAGPGSSASCGDAGGSAGAGGTAVAATATEPAGVRQRDTGADEAGPAGGAEGGQAVGTGPEGASGTASEPADVAQAADVSEAGVSRRLFVARTVAAGAALAAGGTVAAGAYNLLNGPTLKHVTVPLAKLPRSAHGYRIAVVSDIHLGTVLGRGHARRVVRTVNSAQPDLVAIVGDLVDGTVENVGPAAEPLRELRSQHGTFFVTGNHEYFGDAAAWVDHLREMGIHPLENARVEMPGFDLAGVNDVRGEDTGEGPDFEKALGDRDTARASVLLAHQPVQIHEAVDHGVDLQLSGHTHGGQLFPFHLVVGLANPTVAGLERYGDTQLYVTRGAGGWGPPVRVGADPDVTIVRLASKQA